MDRAFEAELYPTAASPLPPAQRVLVFAAHADDEVYGCGGTLGLLAASGVSIAVVIATQGNRCLPEASKTIIEERRRESVEAARILGYADPEFWNIPDRELRYSEKIVQKILHKISALDADWIFAPALSEMHPDHQVLALAVTEAVRRTKGRRHVAFYEVSAPTTHNMLIDISAALEMKIQAMTCFRSQESFYGYDERILALNRYRAYVLGKDRQAAEAFFLLDSDALEQGLAHAYENWLFRRRSIGLAVEPSQLPLVSLIVRSIGRPELREALQSIATQTYPNIEVVLVNATGDGFLHDRWLPERFPVVPVSSPTPLSRSRAANAGLRHASGRYLMFLDEDDLLLPDHVSRLVNALHSQKQAKAAYAGVRAVDETGRPIVEYDEPWSVERMLAANFIPIMAVLFDRSLLDEGCRFDEDLEVSEDWDFWMQAAQKTPFLHVPGISAVYRYYLGESKLSHQRDQNVYLFWRKKVFQKWFHILGIDAFSAALHRLALELDDAHKKTAHLEAAIADLTQAKEDLWRQHESLHEELRRVQAALAMQRDVSHHQSQEMDFLKDRLKALEHEKQMLLNSTAWKVTAPLRFVFGSFHKAKTRFQQLTGKTPMTSPSSDKE